MITINPGSSIEYDNLKIVIGYKKEFVNGNILEVLGETPFDLPKGSRENTSEIQSLGVFLIYQNGILYQIEYACEHSFQITGFTNKTNTFMEIYDQIASKDGQLVLQYEDSIESKKLGIGIWINDVDDGAIYPPDSILIFPRIT